MLIKKLISIATVALLLLVDPLVQGVAGSLGVDSDMLLATLITLLITPVVVPWIED